ncbi:hypothetical protein [Haloferula sp. A504]|uniref:hypothetical protein n=1 Tax=Haloferula sp. A504 TaxID=3373601 RepID=UPI0031C9E1D8|nr:hypothetical protein [Verrucomicrobiaceae bacterium E54]
MKTSRIASLLGAIFLGLLAPGPASAEAADRPSPAPAIQLGAPFCDNAVLQRDMEVPVWGWSEPGTKVTVTFSGHKATATAGKDGKWVARLKPLKTSAEPAEMVITESTGKSVTLKNLLVGEVWLASGQSNMQWVVSRSRVAALAQKFSADTKNQPAPIREFQVTSVTSQLHPIRKATGAWKNGNYGEYSAIAFAFAEKLYREINVPIGILNCSFSQTEIQAWVPREGFASAEDEYSKAIHLKCLQTDPTTPEHQKAWGAFYQSLEDQIAAVDAAQKAGKDAKKITADVPGNLSSNRDATWLFNGRLSPVVPYALRGGIWNQGFANMNEGLVYYNNLHSLIRGWRTVWERPNLPVYFHQFYSAYMSPGKEDNSPSIQGTAEMRHGTWLARDIPHSGMASQIDVTGGIHYINKAVPGQRLALHALKHQYDLKDLVVDGPMYKSYRVEGDKLILEFDHADGGLLVAETETNARTKPTEIVDGDPASAVAGLAVPKIIPDGEDRVKLFYLAGADRVWHPAQVHIDGDKAIVSAPGVKEPRGVSYATAGVGFQPNLYNKAMLPMTPFIVYDHEFVTSENWPDEKLKVAGVKIDPTTVGKLHEYFKMPLLSVQFRDDAVFQADQPVTVWGSTRQWGEWQDEPEEGECKVHFEFGPASGAAQGRIRKVIDVTPEMAEWQVVLPASEASAQPHTLKVRFTIDGEMVHERVITGIIFGDVWCVVTPPNIKVPEVAPSGQIVRMIENQSNRDGRAEPSRFSICTSRTPKNRLAAYWKEAHGLAAAIGNQISAKTSRPVGIIYLKARKDVPIKNWIAPAFLNEAPSLMEDYKTVGSQYPHNPYYLDNVRRYLAEWKAYWKEYIPQMMVTGTVPDGSQWGTYPSPKTDIGDSTACFEYNVYMHSFTPAALSGIVFISGREMVPDDRKHFAPEMAALAKSMKTRFSIQPGPDGGWQTGNRDIPFIYTLPTKTLAPNISTPTIRGTHTAVEVNDWLDATGILSEL